MAGRDLLVLTVYLPPGDYFQRASRGAPQDLGTVVKRVRGLWCVVGDWNMRPAALAESGFPAFTDGVIVAGDEVTCRQGPSSTMSSRTRPSPA